jgi:hypothetical protein
MKQLCTWVAHVLMIVGLGCAVWVGWSLLLHYVLHVL